MPEKPITRPMDIPAGRPVEEEGNAMANSMGPQTADELPEITSGRRTSRFSSWNNA